MPSEKKKTASRSGARRTIQHKKKNAGRRNRADRRMSHVVMGFLVFCLMSFGAIRIMNGRAPAPQPGWYAQDAQQMEILAPAADTAEQRPGEEGASLPFLEATATPAPTVDPYTLIQEPVDATRRPAVEATPEPTAEPTPLPAETAGGVILETPAPSSSPAPDGAAEADGEAVRGDVTEITITCVGDCTLGGDIPTGGYKNFASYAQRYGLDYFLANVRELFQGDDLTIVNLEGPLTNSTDMRSGRAFNFRGYPEYVQILSGSSVEIANVANNHALDYGKAGLEETKSVLENAGIGVSGFSYTYTTDVKGVKVCSLGFTQWDYSQEQIVKSVKSARSDCDLLIVSMHWGKEKQYEPTSEQKRLGKAIIDAGADIVVGTHTHVYGGVELYKGKYILYSLGNFCFGGHKDPDEHNCTIFQQKFLVQKDGAVSDGGIRIIPAQISSSDKTNNFQPKLLTGEEAARQLSRVYDLSTVEAGEVTWLDETAAQGITT